MGRIFAGLLIASAMSSQCFGQAPAQPCRSILASATGDTKVREIFDRVASLKLAKDEFETTAAYAKRRESAMIELRRLLTESAGVPLVVGTLKPTGYKIEYNADAKVLTFSRAWQHSPGAVGLHPLYVSDSRLSLGVTEELDEDGGSYAAKNSFGAEAIVKVMQTKWSGLGLKVDHYRPPAWLYTAQFQAPLDADKARSLKPNIGFRIVGQIAPPFTAFSSEGGRPTVANPLDRRIEYRALVIEPRCAALIDRRDGSVLRWALGG